jgi:hypothetical protein
MTLCIWPSQSAGHSMGQYFGDSLLKQILSAAILAFLLSVSLADAEQDQV